MTFVQRIALGLLVVGVAPMLAFAGPNAGGVLVVHSTNLVYTTDTATYLGQSGIACGQDGPEFPGVQTCPPYDPIGGASPCNVNAADATSGEPLDAAQIWFVLAAFPENSCPRLKATSFGIAYDPALVGIVATGYDIDLGFVIELPSSEDGSAWPANKSGVGLSFTSARTSHLQELYWMAGYAYGAGTLTIEKHQQQDAIFSDDATPPAEDPIAGFGVLGFGGTAGTNPSPSQSFACCVDGICIVHTPADCTELSGTQLATYTCDPETPDEEECGQAQLFACCFDLVCQLLTTDECTLQGGAQQPSTSCEPNPCTIPVDETSWGQIKRDYR